MKEELVLTFGGPGGSRRSTTDPTSGYQLEPTRTTSAEAKKNNPSSEWYDLATPATTVVSRVTGGVSCASDMYGCQRASGGSVYTDLGGPEGSRRCTTDRASD